MNDSSIFRPQNRNSQDFKHTVCPFKSTINDFTDWNPQLGEKTCDQAYLTQIPFRENYQEDRNRFTYQKNSQLQVGTV